MQQEDLLNQRDNETKILIAQINSQNKQNDNQQPEFSEEAKANLQEKMRQFDQKLKLEKDRLAFDKSKAKADERLKEKLINKQSVKSNNK